MHTSSLGFPNMFNVAQNQVAVIHDNTAIANRTRLLLLTEPTEIYNSPEQGVGLRKYIFQYNNSNSIAMLQDRIKSQIKKYEPYAIAEETQFADGLLFTGQDEELKQDYNHLKMTTKIATTYSDVVDVGVDKDKDKEVIYRG